MHSHASSSLLYPLDSSLRALPGRLKFTVRRHKFNTDSLFLWRDVALMLTMLRGSVPPAAADRKGNTLMGLSCRSPRQALRTLPQACSLSHWLVLGAILWAFIAKSYQNLQKLTFD